MTFIQGLCGGRPAIRGRPIRVSDILATLTQDVPEVEILFNFPDLEARDIWACLHFAAARFGTCPGMTLWLDAQLPSALAAWFGETFLWKELFFCRHLDDPFVNQWVF